MALPEDDDRHQIYLAKLTSGLLNSHVYPSQEAAYKALRKMLLLSEEITTQKQLIRILDESGRIIEKEIGGGYKEFTTGLESMAVYEASFSAALVAQYSGLDIKSPAQKQVISFVNQSLMSLTSGARTSSGLWKDYVLSDTSSQKRAINGVITSGYQQGRTVGQMARDIRNLYEGILRTDAEALARTGEAHYANQAREAMAAANPEVKYRVYSATFDNRTTLGCRALHGKAWKITDDSYVRLPRHFNCRSRYQMVASIKEAERGTQAAVGGKDAEKINPNRKLMYRGKRDTDIFKPGQIDAGLSQDEWMRSQPDWFIESSLGKTRAKLFKDGKMNIKKFTDMSGDPISLDQLKRLDAEAFKRAGL